MFEGKPCSMEQVHITGGFWGRKQQMAREVTIPSVYDRFAETGRFDALRADWKEGMPHKPHIFWESDVAKWIEGVAYSLMRQRDDKLEAMVDDLVALMAAYQQPDGYLNVYFTVVEPDARFTRCTDHELYCAGHLIEAAVAYDRATGKGELLRVMRNYADLIDRVFRVERSAGFDTPGHEEIELALYKLYKHTSERRYLALMQHFINTRGTSIKDHSYEWAPLDYMQAHMPVRDQREAVGHSVRAIYLYCGMADLALETRDEALYTACDALFDNMASRRMYITGGLGSTHRGEAFTYDYDLPEYTAYAETCASIAMALFARRMWLIRPLGKYADAAELSVYNTALAGISLSGDAFFYENPLAVDMAWHRLNDTRSKAMREHLPITRRPRVFDCSCCPPNILRLIESVGDFLYSSEGDTIYAHCYMNGDATVHTTAGMVGLSQTTEYPNAGEVHLRTDTTGTYALAMRIPGWARSYALFINGHPAAAQVADGYAVVRRAWAAGDQLTLRLPMDVELVEADPRVRDVCGRVAVTRGPLVYCAEEADNAGLHLRDVRIARATAKTIRHEIIAGEALPVIDTTCTVRIPTNALHNIDPLQREIMPLRLIPYAAWANRAEGDMSVYLLEG